MNWQHKTVSVANLSIGSFASRWMLCNYGASSHRVSYRWLLYVCALFSSQCTGSLNETDPHKQGKDSDGMLNRKKEIVFWRRGEGRSYERQRINWPDRHIGVETNKSKEADPI